MGNRERWVAVLGEKTFEVKTSKQVTFSEFDTTMPEEPQETATVEEAREVANDNVSYGAASRELIADIEELTPEQRYRWIEAAKETSDNYQAMVMSKLDPSFPASAVYSVKNPEHWEELDPMNITKKRCDLRGTELWKVEQDNPSYGNEGSNVTFVDEAGGEYGGKYIENGEIKDVEDGTDGEMFISQRAYEDFSSRGTSTTTIAAFLPDEGEKVEVSKKDTTRYDRGYSNNDLGYLEDHPEIESLIDAIVLADEENEGLEGWVPVEACNEDGDRVTGMRDKVVQMWDTPFEEFYYDFPVVVVIGREGAIAGKRYVAVPEEHAEDANQWFDEKLY